MPITKYYTNQFNDLREISSYLRLGNDPKLRKLCENIERYGSIPSLDSEKKRVTYKRKFENYIFFRTKFFLEKKIFEPNKTAYNFLALMKQHEFFKIVNLLQNHGISLNRTSAVINVSQLNSTYTNVILRELQIQINKPPLPRREANISSTFFHALSIHATNNDQPLDLSKTGPMYPVFQ